ncbi:MAG: sigma-70 family RNA polymerase sigma factor [Planctomycetota bacterium]
MKHLDDRDDGVLIRSVLAGDEGAFGELLRRYEDRVHRLLSRFTRDRMESEDLAQEVFVKVFRKLHTFQSDSSFFTWLYRIAINTATDYSAHRKRRRLHLVEDAAALDPGDRDEDGAAGPLLESELRQVTREVLSRLPEKYRTILILREYEDLSYTEMAEVLGCSIGTVESRLFRARRRFKEALERSHPDLVPQMRGGHRA